MMRASGRFTLVHDRPVPFSAIEMFLDLLRSAHGDKLLRMKGIIELVDDPSRPLVVHGVQKLLHPPVRLPAWPDETRGTRLVLITLDMPQDYVRRMFPGVHRHAVHRHARQGCPAGQSAVGRRLPVKKKPALRPACSLDDEPMGGSGTARRLQTKPRSSQKVPRFRYFF